MAAAAQINASTRFQIRSNHPALPGHFPGAPTVPGVLLLAEGLHQLETHCGRAFKCQRIERAKFLQPVAPGATITATLSLDAAGQGTLNLHVEKSLVAQATLTLSQAAGDPSDS
jgi:3-hydroxymyristoyl/3-hydroxydecanoyl-(acyl carrier protein) dehydratase